MIQSYEGLSADFAGLKAKYADDGKAVAAELARRGATCVTNRSVGYEGEPRLTIYNCTYFFCKGSWLQHLGWRFPENDAALVRTQESFRRRNGTDVVYIDYTLAQSETCSSKDTIREKQREFALRGGGKEFAPGILN